MEQKPKIRFPEFLTDWEKIKLNKVLQTNSSKNKKGEFKKKDMLSVSSSAGVVNQIEYHGRSYAGESALSYNILLKNEVVYTKSPLKEYPYGIIKFNDFESGIVSTLYAVYTIRKNYNGNFIDYYFQLPLRINKYLKPLVNIGAKNDMKVNNEKVLIDPVYFPSLPEQQKIASFLTKVDEKITHLTKKAELLEKYKKGVMQQIFKQEIRFKDDTSTELSAGNGNEFPKWAKVGGNELFENISDKNHNSDLPILAITQDQGAIPRHLIDYNISVTEKSVDSYKVVQIGDFVISLRSFQGGIEYSNYQGICSPAYIILRPTTENVDRAFYKFYLKTSNYIKELQKNLEGIRDGKMVSYKYFSEIKLPFPCIEEQKKIASFLSTIDNKINQVNTQLSQAKTWKKGLLQKMFC